MQTHYRKILPALALAALVACAQPAQAAEGPGLDVRFQGYTRLRFDSTWRANNTARYRPRIMAQAGVIAKPVPGLEVGLRLSTGNPGDPTTANQSFTDFDAKKAFNLDRFYAIYRLGDLFAAGAGKFGNPFWTTALVWDSDMQPEGAFQALSFKDMGALKGLTFTFGQFLLTELTDQLGSGVLGLQGKADLELADAWAWSLGTSYYHYAQENKIAVAQGEGRLLSGATNAVRKDAAGKVIGYAQRYAIWDALSEVSWRGPVRIALTAHYAQNTAATVENRAVLGRLSFGQLKKAGDWQFNYTYTALDRDAVVSAFNDSDLPSTDISGHILQGYFMPADPVTLAAQLYVTPKATTVFLDTAFKF